MVDSTVTFFKNLAADGGKLVEGKKPWGFHSKTEAITSVALRAIGALVTLIAAAVLLSGIGLALTGSVGSGVFTAIGAIALGIIAYDMITVGRQQRGLLTSHGIQSIFAHTIVARHLATWLEIRA